MIGMEMFIKNAFIKMEKEKDSTIHILKMEILIINSFLRMEKKKENLFHMGIV